MRLHGSLAALVCFGLGLGLARAAAADDVPTASELALARNEYKRGVAATKKERWEEAYEAFFRAFELSQRPAILLNLGSAQAKTGRLVEARESYQGFLREAPKSEVAKHKRDAESVLKELEARIPKAVIVVEGIEPLDRLVIDDQEVAKAVLGAELPLNPGAHVIEVMREGAVATRGELALVEKETKSIRLKAVRQAASAAPIAEVKIAPPAVVEQQPAAIAPMVTAVEPQSQQPGLLDSPIFWIVAGVLVAGGAVATGLALSGSEERYRGSTGIVLEAP